VTLSSAYQLGVFFNLPFFFLSRKIMNEFFSGASFGYSLVLTSNVRKSLLFGVFLTSGFETGLIHCFWKGNDSKVLNLHQSLSSL